MGAHVPLDAWVLDRETIVSGDEGLLLLPEEDEEGEAEDEPATSGGAVLASAG